MNYLAYLEGWVTANRAALDYYGQVSFSVGQSDVRNRSAHLLVVLSPDSDAELLLWESGDADFNHGPFARSVLEHIELESMQDLEVLLHRFMQAVTGGSTR